MNIEVIINKIYFAFYPCTYVRYKFQQYSKSCKNELKIKSYISSKILVPTI